MVDALESNQGANSGRERDTKVKAYDVETGKWSGKSRLGQTDPQTVQFRDTAY